MKQPQGAKHPKPARAANSLRNTTFYGVITCSLLVGLTGYAAGASLETALMRIMVTLLACSAVGYLLNLCLMMAGSTTSPAGSEVAAPEAGRVNLTIGDDQA